MNKKRYVNESEEWGGSVEVTVADYVEQARVFGMEIDIEERADGIYIDGRRVAELITGRTK